MNTTEDRQYAEGWGAGYHGIVVPAGTPTTDAWRRGYGQGAVNRNRGTVTMKPGMHYTDDELRDRAREDLRARVRGGTQ